MMMIRIVIVNEAKKWRGGDGCGRMERKKNGYGISMRMMGELKVWWEIKKDEKESKGAEVAEEENIIFCQFHQF